MYQLFKQQCIFCNDRFAHFFPFPALAFLGLPIPVSCETFCQFLKIHATFSFNICEVNFYNLRFRLRLNLPIPDDNAS